MTKGEKGRIVTLASIGILAALLVWMIIATLPEKEPDTGVVLRSTIKDSYTLDDMLKSVRKEMPAQFLRPQREIQERQKRIQLTFQSFAAFRKSSE